MFFHLVMQAGEREEEKNLICIQLLRMQPLYEPQNFAYRCCYLRDMKQHATHRCTVHHDENIEV